MHWKTKKKVLGGKSFTEGSKIYPTFNASQILTKKKKSFTEGSLHLCFYLAIPRSKIQKF